MRRPESAFAASLGGMLDPTSGPSQAQRWPEGSRDQCWEAVTGGATPTTEGMAPGRHPFGRQLAHDLASNLNGEPLQRAAEPVSHVRRHGHVAECQVVEVSVRPRRGAWARAITSAEQVMPGRISGVMSL